METWRAECGCWGDNGSYHIQMGAETPGAATRPGEAQAFVGQIMPCIMTRIFQLSTTVEYGALLNIVAPDANQNSVKMFFLSIKSSIVCIKCQNVEINK